MYASICKSSKKAQFVYISNRVISFVLVPEFSDRLSNSEYGAVLDFEGARWNEKHPVEIFDAKCTIFFVKVLVQLCALASVYFLIIIDIKFIIMVWVLIITVPNF